MKNRNIYTYSMTIIVMVVAIGIIYFGGKYVYYGSLVRNCIYTSNNVPVPKQIAEGRIVVVKDAYLAVGINEEYTCLKDFGNIDREIVGNESINNPTIGKEYYTDKGLLIKPLKTGASFEVTGIIAVTKHGISTIDSGPGPIYYLILKDKNGITYQIATVSLGLNKSDLFLGFEKTTKSSLQLLSWESFNALEK